MFILPFDALVLCVFEDTSISPLNLTSPLAYKAYEFDIVWLVPWIGPPAIYNVAASFVVILDASAERVGASILLNTIFAIV